MTPHIALMRKSGAATFSSRLRESRERRQWTRPDLASLSGLSANHIYLLETTERPNVAARMVVALAQALNVSTDWLLCLSDVEHPCDCQCPCHGKKKPRRRE